jgi:hypothetical protein
MREHSLVTTRHRLLILPSAAGLLAALALGACSDEGVDEGEPEASADALLAGESTLWSSTTVPKTVDTLDEKAVELGVRFVADQDGFVSGVRFYKSRRNRGEHVGHLWSETGALLATQTFRSETTSGWQTVRFDAPIPVKAGVRYIASYHTDRGHYASDVSYFQGKGVDRAPLHAPADSATAHNGVYRYGAAGFPADSYRATNYWVDVVFKASAADGGTSTLDGGGTTDSGTSTADAGGSTDGGTPAMPSACAAYPAFPDANCTGYRHTGVALERVPQDVTSGPGWVWRTVGGVGVLDVTSSGAVLDGLDIQGPVYNNGGTDARTALKLTITRSLIRCIGENNFCLTLGPGSVATDVEVGGGADGKTFIGTLGVLTGNWTKAQALTTITRMNLHHVVQGFRQDGDSLIQDSYVHDMTMGDAPAPDGHSECVFVSAGANNSLVHNTMSHGNSAVIFVQHGGSPNPLISNLVIRQNRLIAVLHNGQNSTWGVTIENKGIGSNIQVTDNVFDKTGWGAGPGQAPPGSTTTGNKYTDGTTATITGS